jgi:hypothetical protein
MRAYDTVAIHDAAVCTDVESAVALEPLLEMGVYPSCVCWSIMYRACRGSRPRAGSGSRCAARSSSAGRQALTA